MGFQRGSFPFWRKKKKVGVKKKSYFCEETYRKIIFFEIREKKLFKEKKKNGETSML
jgi:hypothetical protein